MEGKAMSAISTGGFTGADALLALATLQQANWNEQMSNEMRVAKLQSEMASDLASIKSHLETANRDPERFAALQEELHAFEENYGSIPELDPVTDAVAEITRALDGRMPATLAASGDDGAGAPIKDQPAAQQPAYGRNGNAGGAGGTTPQSSAPANTGRAEIPNPPTPKAFEQSQVDNWLQTLTEKLDACSTNDQLRMIQIKQLNDNINNNSGMVSGLIESRNNATASIINNLA